MEAASGSSSSSEHSVSNRQVLEAIGQNNMQCVECDSNVYSAWVSITYGTLLCLKCAGAHRSLGVSLSRVKDTHLGESYSQKELKILKLGGNANFKKNVKKNYSSIKLKYESDEAKAYKKKLDHIVGLELLKENNKLHGLQKLSVKPEPTAENEDSNKRQNLLDEKKSEHSSKISERPQASNVDEISEEDDFAPIKINAPIKQKKKQGLSSLKSQNKGSKSLMANLNSGSFEPKMDYMSRNNSVAKDLSHHQRGRIDSNAYSATTAAKPKEPELKYNPRLGFSSGMPLKHSDQKKPNTTASIVDSPTNKDSPTTPNKSQEEPGVINKVFSSFKSMKDGFVDSYFNHSSNID